MDNGISIYPGLDNTLEENIDLIERAHHCGFRRVFTSLHIPETNYDALKSELSELLRTARRCDMEVISDISPATMELLGIREFSPSAFRMLGITTLRLDYGFGLDALIAKNDYDSILVLYSYASFKSDTNLYKAGIAG